MTQLTRYLVVVENARGSSWAVGIYTTATGARKRAERESKRAAITHVDVWTLRPAEHARIKGGLRVIEGGRS